MKQAAATPPATYPQEAKAVVLHKEQRITVEEDGRITETTFRAVRILSREGRREAHALVGYNTESGKVKELKAWLIRSTGEVKAYGKQQTMEIAEVDNDIYNEHKVRVIEAADDAEAGSVFGFESVSEERTVFSQQAFSFQAQNPVALSRFVLNLPAGWRAEGVTFNHAKIEPTVNGTSYTWELRDLPYLEDEPASPSFSNLAPRLVVNLIPPTGKATPLRTFATWQDVARYSSELHATQVTPNEALIAKARELTATAKTEYEKIKVIGKYAQSVNYISINIDTSRGGGYRPHTAIDVFAKNYGDCKDKANLMRAMLKAVGIEAHPVAIFSGDPTYVRQEWPSPHQFNHCIIAVKVSDATEAATVIKHPTLGRLLIFDPTDENTQVGDLPDHEQGSWALICSAENGDLVKMPVTPPEANQLERTIEGTLDIEGNLSVTLKENSTGQSAVTERRYFKKASQSEYVKLTERWIARNAPGSTIGKVAPADDAAASKFALEVEFKTPGYAKSMRGRLLMFKAAPISRGETPYLAKETRKHPVVLESQAFKETTRIKLPEGFEPDEMPDSIELSESFGKYAASWEIKDGYLHFKRALVLQAATIPVADYAKVRGFFGRVLGAENAPVVLAKK
ncbi:MAG: DUF3857 and transglutaminase domain-containing protein [Acidobacteria bacterium]|nr:DUF3857 and transglutaminase domain-containing protein [Acidobacteriota bacterium]